MGPALNMENYLFQTCLSGSILWWGLTRRLLVEKRAWLILPFTLSFSIGVGMKKDGEICFPLNLRTLANYSWNNYIVIDFWPSWHSNHQSITLTEWFGINTLFLFKWYKKYIQASCMVIVLIQPEAEVWSAQLSKKGVVSMTRARFPSTPQTRAR